MEIKGIIFEDFVNYKKPCMTIEMPHCNFKCDKECGRQVCQNSALASAPIINCMAFPLIKKYQDNPITQAVCFQGLEPFDSFSDILSFCYIFRNNEKIQDDIVIYTGYTEEEIEDKINRLALEFKNIIVKFGRYIPDQESHFDEVLGVKLASPNQYARRIS